MLATAPLPETSKLTYEDFRDFPADGKRHELIDGEHFMSPAPYLKHQRLVLALGAILREFVKRTGAGEVFVAPVDVVLSDFDVVEPDLAFVSKTRRDILTEANIQGAPDLVVEVLSDSTRRHDLVTKRRLYGRFGVREYWVVDPVVDNVLVFVLAGFTLERRAELALEARDLLKSELLPGFELPLTELFEE